MVPLQGKTILIWFLYKIRNIGTVKFCSLLCSYCLESKLLSMCILPHSIFYIPFTPSSSSSSIKMPFRTKFKFFFLHIGVNLYCLSELSTNNSSRINDIIHIDKRRVTLCWIGQLSETALVIKSFYQDNLSVSVLFVLLFSRGF